MTWLTPLTGAILAAAIIPPLVLLYFLKLRRRPQAIASTLLWKKSVEDLHANAPFQKLRRNLLLFLQLLVLCLLAAAVMQPQMRARKNTGGKTVLLIDNSASMTAIDTDTGVSRLDLAREAAKEQIEAMYAGGWFSRSPGQTMVLAFSNRVQPMIRFSDSKQQILSAIDSIQPTHGSTFIADALKLARAQNTNVVDAMGEARPVGPTPAFHLYSDGRIEDLADQLLRNDEMDKFTFHSVGSDDPDNVAITAISVQRQYDQPNAVEIFASLVNFNSFPISCDVQLSINDVVSSIKEFALPAMTDDEEGVNIPGRNHVLFRLDNLPHGAVLGITNLREDDFAADNIARVVLPPPKKLAVLLVGQNRFLTRMALEGMSLQKLEIVSGEQYQRLVQDGRLDQYDVIILDNYAPPSDEFMPPARYLTVGPTPPLAGLTDFGFDEAGFVLTMKQEHPVFRFVNLDNLFVSQQRLIQPSDDVVVLAEGRNGPFVMSLDRGSLHVIHVAFDPLQSNWPFQRSFVTFMFNAVEYLGQLDSTLSHQAYSPGEALTIRLPVNATDISVHTPQGMEESIQPLDPAQTSWGPILLTGLHVMSWQVPGNDEPLSHPFAVNLLDEIESNIKPASELVLGSHDVTAAGQTQAGYVPLWPWALALSLLILMIEWWIYHRRVFL